MAITFIQQRRRQKALIWIFTGTIFIGLILVWQFVLKPKSVSPPAITSSEISRMTKKIDIDFNAIRNPLSVDFPAFSVNLSAEPDSGIPPLKEVSLVVSVQEPIVGPFSYKFDCNNDGNFEKEVEDTFEKNYTAKNICSYEKEGNYTAKVYAEAILTYYSQKGEKLTQKKNATAQTNILVKTLNHSPVISRCDVSPTEGTTQTNFNFNFTAEATDLDKDPLYYLWEFGDGATSTEQNPNHNYTKVGSYTPRVTVSDGKGGKTNCSPFSLSLLKNLQFFNEVSLPEIKIGRENPFKPY